MDPSAGVHLGQIPEAHSTWERSRGLIGREAGEIGRGLLIARCRCVHTFGMRCALDLVFVDDRRRVVAVRSEVPPWRVVFGGWSARHTVELPPGKARQLRLVSGTEVAWDAT